MVSSPTEISVLLRRSLTQIDLRFAAMLFPGLSFPIALCCSEDIRSGSVGLANQLSSVVIDTMVHVWSIGYNIQGNVRPAVIGWTVDAGRWIWPGQGRESGKRFSGIFNTGPESRSPVLIDCDNGGRMLGCLEVGGDNGGRTMGILKPGPEYGNPDLLNADATIGDEGERRSDDVNVWIDGDVYGLYGRPTVQAGLFW